MPTFLVIGGKKCGTTALYFLLREHPSLCMPQKEVHFFSNEGRDAPRPHMKTDLDSYQALFADCGSTFGRGEASPSYLHEPTAPNRIRHHIPDVKLLAVLRHPVDRIYSDYLHEVRQGNEPAPDLASALRKDEHDHRFNYKVKSRYSAHLTRYFDLFPREQIYVTVYQDFLDEPLQFVQDIYRFLEVDPQFVPDTTIRTKASGLPRNRALHRIISTTNPVKAFTRRLLPREVYTKIGYRLHNRNIVKPPLDPGLRRELVAEFSSEAKACGELLGRDLSAWWR